MENRMKKLARLKTRRAIRVRKRLRGTGTTPRLCVVKTNAHLLVQLIDDDKGYTLANVSTLGKEYKGTEFCKKSKTSARQLGTCIAEKAKELKIESVIFDRGKSKYHGVLAELADAARAAGLKF